MPHLAKIYLYPVKSLDPVSVPAGRLLKNGGLEGIGHLGFSTRRESSVNRQAAAARAWLAIAAGRDDAHAAPDRARMATNGRGRWIVIGRGWKNGNWGIFRVCRDVQGGYRRGVSG